MSARASSFHLPSLAMSVLEAMVAMQSFLFRSCFHEHSLSCIPDFCAQGCRMLQRKLYLIAQVILFLLEIIRDVSKGLKVFSRTFIWCYIWPGS